jgi:hypothetical protein
MHTVMLIITEQYSRDGHRLLETKPLALNLKPRLFWA